MWPAFVATTYPSPPPPEIPLTLFEWACVSWFAVPLLLVVALAWSFSRRRRAAPPWRMLPFSSAAVLSLLLFAATAGLAASGYDRPLFPFEWPQVPIERFRVEASAYRGSLYFGVMAPPTHYLQPSRVRFGFGYYHQSAYAATTSNRLVTVGTMHQLVAPLWALLALSAVMPAVWLMRAMGFRRDRKRGLCTSCGYDLRETPGRCPECGAVPGSPRG